jgi:hypothetical protein
MAKKEDLIEKLENDGDQYFEAGRTNNLFDLALSIAAILASLIAGVLIGALKKECGVIAASVAAILLLVCRSKGCSMYEADQIGIFCTPPESEPRPARWSMKIPAA